MNTATIKRNFSESSEKINQIKWFASTHITLHWKNIYALIVIPKKWKDITHIYFHTLIDNDLREKALEYCNASWKNHSSRKALFQPAEKNIQNLEILKHAQIFKKVWEFNSLNKTQYETQQQLDALLQQKNHLESEIWKYKKRISEIQNQKSEKNIEQYYSKKCYIYQNTHWAKILVILKDDWSLFECFGITNYEKPISYIQKQQIIKKLQHKSSVNKHFSRILETPINMEKMRNIVKHGLSVRKKNNQTLKFPIPEENKNINFCGHYENSSWKKIVFEVKQGKVITANDSNGNDVNHQQKSAIQRLLNQRKFSKFQINNIETILKNKYKKLQDDCELFLWSIQQSSGNKEVENSLSLEFIEHLKQHFKVTNIRQVLHKTHPDKAQNDEERRLFTQISQIVTNKFRYFKQLEKNNI